MTYNPFFDYYFSSIGLSVGFPFLLLLLAVLLLKRYGAKNGLTKWLLILLFPTALFLLITAGTLNQVFLGYGRPVQISALHPTNKGLIVIDYIRTMGGKSSNGVSYFRIHRLDPISGKKTIRFNAGESGEFAGTKGDTLSFAHYDQVSLYSIRTGKVIQHYDKETLPLLFTVLSNGLHEVNWRWGSLYVTATNGTKWIIDPLSNTILPDSTQNSTAYQPTFKLYLNNGVVLYDDKPGGTEMAQLEGRNNNNLLKYLTRNDVALHENLSFLEGEIVGVSTQDSCFIIRSYTSTEKKGFIYTAVSLNGKIKRWEINSSFLSPDQSTDHIHTNLTLDETNGLFFFSYRKEVFGGKLKSGKILWRTVL